MARSSWVIVGFGLVACGAERAAEAPTQQVAPADALAALDTREPVPLVPQMALHQKQNMQDHLLVVQQITDGLARDDWPAIEAAASRFASSPQMQMQCEHMGQGADGFTERALDFHQRADAIVAAAKEKDGTKVLTATAHALEGCTGCHARYRQDVVSEAEWTERTGTPTPSMHPCSSRVPDVFDPSLVDEAEVIADEESFATARRLQAEEGLLVGGSSGTVVAAALRVAARARPGDGPVVALLADSWDRYLSKPWMG